MATEQELWRVDKGRNVGWTVSKHTEDAYTEFLIYFEAEAHALATLLNALEARAEADRQAREDAIAAERATYDLMLSRAIEANVQRDRAETAEARLVRCGGENCMGFDASKPGWPVARWVREERLRAAEAERDALRARAELYEETLRRIAYLLKPPRMTNYDALIVKLVTNALTTPAASQEATC